MPDCIDKKCAKKVNSNLSDILIIPFEHNNAELRKLFSYFLHCAPDTASLHAPHIERDKHQVIFERMMLNRHFKYQKFCSSNTPIQNEFLKAGLEGDCFCLKCKRYVCKKKKTNKGEPQETDLDCFVRHIRNSIAHGRVYCHHSGNAIHIIFEDTNKSGNLSARIICIKADLQHWKSVLSDSRNYT